MPQNILQVVLLGWLVVLTVAAVLIGVYVRRLSKGVDKGNLISILENVLKKEEKNTKGISDITKSISGIEKDIRLHIKKVGLVRYNPFQEMGGDHSFSLALLDSKLDGFLITSLHARERTRVYIKEIKNGKSKFELSNEESKALKEALKHK